ncbi:MAG: hypothetical protein PHD01_16830, partial [Geobacteraceae bacterium]|nr:hypothetical protein [Geobacteraceae bacterium]
TPIGTSTYGKSLTSTDDGGAVSSTHRVFGTSAIIGSHGITASDTNMAEGGPCVTCHMNSGGGKAKHSLKMDAYAYDNVCVKCHTSEGTHSGAVALNSSNYATAFLEPQAAGFNSALNLALIELEKNFQIVYDSAVYPYFFPVGAAHTSANGVKDWTLTGALTTTNAKKLMGACFNINLLKREPAAYAHARTYSRRLLYDTIDWLDNKTIDLSVSATAVVDDAAEFTKGTTAYSVPLTTIDPGTTEGMLFLLGWNRTSGAWSSPERP